MAEKYFEVINVLKVRMIFKNLTQILRGKVSRGTIRRILVDGQKRGVFDVERNGREVFYQLADAATSLSNPILFFMWWLRGRPHLSGFSIPRSDIWTLFTVFHRPHMQAMLLKEEIGDSVLKEGDVSVVRLRDLYQKIGRRIKSLTGEIERRIMKGEDPHAINQWMSSIKISEEENILSYVSALLEEGRYCKKCFEKNLIVPLRKAEKGYVCMKCGGKYKKLKNPLLPTFKKWLAEGEKQIKLRHFYAFIPR